MRKNSRTTLFVFLALASYTIVAGCASSEETVPKAAKTAKNRCSAGEVWMCESRSTTGISDGRHGARDGRQKSCGCGAMSSLDEYIPAQLPVDNAF